MIIWLASYPKSGNTLVRSMLSSYFFSNDGLFNFDLIKNIRQFPTRQVFQKYDFDFNDTKETIKNYINIQDKFNIKNSVQFVKTHSYLFNINNYAFTNLKNSLGTIYIIRDPRNVVTSWANHYSCSIEESCDFELGAVESLAKEGEVMVYKHEGNWECMDHERDVQHLNKLWNTGKAFWKK